MSRFARLTVALAILLAAATSVAAEGARFERLTIRSKLLGQEREIIVRTPAGYDGHDAPYPVLYVTDGPAQLALLSETVRFLARNGRMPELVIVGIAHIDRTQELTPTRGSLPGVPLPFETSGGADAFLGFLEKELIPFVEQRYRTAPYRILAGHSFGGLFALHTLTARPELFQARIAVSPTFLWDGELPLKRVEALVAKRPDLATTLVYTVGDEGEENDRAFRRFDAFASKAGPKVRAKGIHLAGEDHGTVVFDSHYRALREIFDGWRMPIEEGAVGPKGGFAAVEAHYRGVSERLGMLVAPPEQTLNLAGYQLLQEGKLDDAVATFRRGAEIYTGSPNAHDSLGEALEKKGELQAALASYRKAVSLGEKRKDPLLAAFRANRDRVERLVREAKR
jgi:predicted alpha/beta superfamily hydrolase